MNWWQGVKTIHDSPTPGEGEISFLLIYLLYLHFRLCWICVAVQAFLSLQWAGAALSLCVRTSCCGFSCCGARASEHLGSVAEAPRLWNTGSIVVALELNYSKARGIFSVRDWSLVSCLVRWIPHHWATMSFLIASHWVIFAPYKDKFWGQGTYLLHLSVLNTRKGLGMWCWQKSCFMNESNIIGTHLVAIIFIGSNW